MQGSGVGGRSRGGSGGHWCLLFDLLALNPVTQGLGLVISLPAGERGGLGDSPVWP